MKGRGTMQEKRLLNDEGFRWEGTTIFSPLPFHTSHFSQYPLSPPLPPFKPYSNPEDAQHTYLPPSQFTYAHSSVSPPLPFLPNPSKLQYNVDENAHLAAYHLHPIFPWKLQCNSKLHDCSCTCTCTVRKEMRWDDFEILIYRLNTTSVFLVIFLQQKWNEEVPLPLRCMDSVPRLTSSPDSEPILVEQQ